VRSMTELTNGADDARHPHGQVHTAVVDGHVLHMTVDRVEKKNAFTPKITRELGAAMTRLDEDPDLWVGVLSFAGDHTTAGLDMPLFFGPDADRAVADGPEPVDPFGLGRRLRKPLVSAVQGITFTIGIEIPLAGDVIVAAADARFCQLEPKRGLAPLGGATIRYVQRAGWGNAMYHLLTADEFSAAEALRIGLVQEVVDPGGQVERALAIAATMAACAPLALVHTIANARLALEEGEPAAAARIPAMSEEVRATADFQEGISSFVERRAANFAGR
jgi:enoyl-CoA hydratase/carnithine racemase